MAELQASVVMVWMLYKAKRYAKTLRETGKMEGRQAHRLERGVIGVVVSAARVSAERVHLLRGRLDGTLLLDRAALSRALGDARTIKRAIATLVSDLALEDRDHARRELDGEGARRAGGARLVHVDRNEIIHTHILEGVDVVLRKWMRCRRDAHREGGNRTVIVAGELESTPSVMVTMTGMAS